MPDYKLPICFLGTTHQLFGMDASGKPMGDLVITEEMVEMNCQCLTARKAFFCMEGHLTECHVGKTCVEAGCDHYRRQRENEREEDY